MGDNEDSHTALSQNRMQLVTTYMHLHIRSVGDRESSEALYCTVHDDGYSIYTGTHTDDHIHKLMHAHLHVEIHMPTSKV